MKFRDAVKLGHLNIRQQKRRSLMMAVVIGAVLCLLLVVNLMMAGVRRNVESLGKQTADGKILVMTTARVECLGLECEFLDLREVEARQNIQKYGGEVLAEVGLEGMAYSLPEELLEGVIEVPLVAVPDGVRAKVVSLSNASMLAMITIPQTMDAKSKLEAVERVREKVMGEVRERDEKREMIVGILPYALVENLSLENVGDKWNPLNIVLENVKTTNEYGEFYVRTSEEKVDKVVGVVASFGTAEEAYNYMRDDDNYYSALDDGYTGEKFEVREILGSGVDNFVRFKVMQMVVNVVSVGLMVLAMVVLVTTVVRLIGQERKTIKLYYALGASGKDVWLVYFLYVIELCLVAIGLALLVAVLIALGVSWLNAGNLKTVVELGYGVKDYVMVLVGWSREISWLIVGVFVAGLMGVVCSRKVLRG